RVECSHRGGARTPLGGEKMISRSKAFGAVALLATVALIGLGGVPAGAAVGSSHPTACEGFVLMNPIDGTNPNLQGTISIDADLSCAGAPGAGVQFFGTAAWGTTEDMCSGREVSVQFSGTEFV